MDDKNKKEEEYAQELTPPLMNYRWTRTKEQEEDNLGFFRGLFFGVLLAIPLWMLIIWAFFR